MLVYLKLITFNECKSNDHYMCSGATLRVDDYGAKRVTVCNCKCHEIESKPATVTVVEVSK